MYMIQCILWITDDNVLNLLYYPQSWGTQTVDSDVDLGISLGFPHNRTDKVLVLRDLSAMISENECVSSTSLLHVQPLLHAKYPLSFSKFQILIFEYFRVHTLHSVYFQKKDRADTAHSHFHSTDGHICCRSPLF